VTDWRDNAECKGMDPDLFYPGRGGMKDLRTAQAVCRTCVVRQDCLDYAVAAGEDHGVWGGMSERQRILYRRRLKVGKKFGGRSSGQYRPAACGTDGGYYQHRRQGTSPCQPCLDAHYPTEGDDAA
jgi:WhiB family redox-sensing transcriptional regulator